VNVTCSHQRDVQSAKIKRDGTQVNVDCDGCQFNSELATGSVSPSSPRHLNFSRRTGCIQVNIRAGQLSKSTPERGAVKSISKQVTSAYTRLAVK